MNSRLLVLLTVVAVVIGFANSAVADPFATELLKFYQMPLNNGVTPYLVPPRGSNPAGSTYGTVLSTALFPGHDELSTARRTSQDIPWTGTFMADDFADYAGTPVSHVRWWGSYIDQLQPRTAPGVQRFLISFEQNVPAAPDPTNPNITIPSHPDVFNPNNLHQIVTFVGGVAPPPPGTFTEKFVPTPIPAGSPPPKELLYEYNAELHLDKWFREKAAAPLQNNVYWLKIVALVNDFNPAEQGIEWGWHNRDWSIKDDLAARPGDTPDGAERALPTGIPAPPVLWHFEDDAVSGQINVFPGTAAMPFMPANVEQFNMLPQNYLAPWDVPTPLHNQFSKDLAFELYTPVPEPASVALFGLALVGVIGWRRRH